MHGKGKMTWSTGTIFEGDWVLGQYVKGRMASHDGGQVNISFCHLSLRIYFLTFFLF